MTLDRQRRDELYELIDALLDESLDASAQDRLADILAASEEAQSVYVSEMNRHASLAWDWGNNEQAGQRCVDEPSEFSIQALPLIDAPAFSLHASLGNVFFSYAVATVVFAIGLMAGLWWNVSSFDIARHMPDNNTAEKGSQKAAFIARITGTVDCRWGPKGLGIREWGLERGRKQAAQIALGDTLVLTSGLLQITYNSGAIVILQGPVTYEVDSADSGFLSVGKLTARVEKSGKGREGEAAAGGQCLVTSELANLEAPAHRPSSSLPLFTVRTPTAIVTDLGTEFGVEANEHGYTTSHVFCGSVRVQTLSDEGRPEGVGLVLHEDEAVRVEKDGIDRTTDSRSLAKQPDFVRAMPKRLVKIFDLVDVVAGGDGFSGRRGRGIDPTSGRPSDTFVRSFDEWHVGDGRYHRVETLPFVDGVFIPDGTKGPVQIDSAHSLAHFGKTSNFAACCIWAGGPIDISSTLGGMDYASTGHGFLFLHANNGITFDLDAIRRANPDHKLSRFLTMAGNTETGTAAGRDVFADFWVLVDGQPRFRRSGVNRNNGAYPISIVIKEGDRFLTLAVTDGGNDISYDWIIFGDPRLELVAGKAAIGSDARKSP